MSKAGVELAKGRTVDQVVKIIGVTVQTCYRWRKEYGGLRMNQAKRHRTVDRVRDALGRDQFSERRACRVFGQPRSTQRRTPHMPDDEPRLVKRMIELDTEYGQHGSVSPDHKG